MKPDSLMDPDGELVEVVDSSGAVIDVVPRHRMRAEHLRHRCTYVAVVKGRADADPTAMLRADSLLRADGLLRADSLFNADTVLVVHQRADWKDTYPSYWDVAFGGVCGVGEAWQTSAERELAEEAGIDGATLHELGPTSYEADDNRVVGRLYIAAWPAEPVCVDGEVVAIDHVPLAELQSWVETVEVCPDSAAVVVPALLRLIA